MIVNDYQQIVICSFFAQLLYLYVLMPLFGDAEKCPCADIEDLKRHAGHS